MSRKITAFGQTMESCVLPNGLTVCYFPKPGFRKKFALYATRYGAVDAVFRTADGLRHETPAGVAHFLEHKVFEQKDGNALQKLSALGSSPNAFTAQTMTAYHFECTDRFYENLDVLLDFVHHPYFTDENVSKEQGIIGQEIGMVEDNPGWRSYTGLFEALFPDHRIRTSIIGTVDSIAQITPQILYDCHGTFYSPDNMVLTVAGDLDFERIVDAAMRLSPSGSRSPKEREYALKDAGTGDRIFRMSMEVSQPIFMAGFRDVPPESGEERARHTLIASLAGNYLMGESSPLFAAAYAQNLIDRDFETEYIAFPGGGVLIAGGESREPETVVQMLLSSAEDAVRDGVDEARFSRLLRAAYGSTVRKLNSLEALCCEQAEAVFSESDFLNLPACYETIRAEDVRRYIADAINRERMGLSFITPR